MTILNDTHLAYLLSLGFELDLCKQALTQNSTLENATEWILDPTHPPVLSIPGASTTSPMETSPPSFDSAPSTSSTTSVPHATFSTRPDAQKEAEELKQAQKKKFEQISNELKRDRMLEREARQRAIIDIKEDREKRKMKSHPSQTGSSKPVLTERERMQLSLKEEKRLDQEQRRRVLANIRNDQKDRKSKPVPEQSTAVPAVKPVDKSSDAFIQLKLTNGSTVRQKFPATAKLGELFEFALVKEVEINQSATLDNLSLFCAFPRKTFTQSHGEMDMQEAGFLPNVSLNVLVALPAPVVEEQQDVSPMDEDRMNSDSSDNSDDSNDEDELDFHLRHDPNLLRRRQRVVGATTSGGHQLSDPSPAAEPQDTVMEENETVPEEISESDRRVNMLSAIQQRNNSVHDTNTKHTRVMKGRDPKRLKDICTTIVASLLTQHTVSANRYLKKLVYVSADVAESLLSYLIKCGKLNVSTLRKLANHCYLQHVVLDSYTYCTDSLIEDLIKSNSSISITKLSLRGCDVITDGAIRSLEGLKNLNYLDLNNCKVTDKGLKSVEKLQHLVYLNLSKTKITNAGLSSLVKNAKFKSELQVLLLDGCTRLDSISSILIPIINEFTNLIQLSFGYTTSNANQSSADQKLTNKDIKLEKLDVNHTCIQDQDLIGTVSQFKSLVELKLGGCEAITTRGLSFLPRELTRLKYIQFPDREHELDDILSKYKDLPIEHLDLAGFLNITDEGAKYIACMKHLRYLSLDGTKVTDQGIMLFENLIELEKLYLDRTLLTDVGIEKLRGLSKLETLSLCRTEVSDEGLCCLGDFEQTSFARNLRTLNLAQCIHVTDRGVRGLAGMANLTNLNLDHTGVSKSCLKYLKDLKNLNLVRLQGIEKEEDDTMEYE